MFRSQTITDLAEVSEAAHDCDPLCGALLNQAEPNRRSLCVARLRRPRRDLAKASAGLHSCNSLTLIEF
ncbi:MAG: hypothetical protein AB4038_10410 [Prochloraceae cyanobacterium]